MLMTSWRVIRSNLISFLKFYQLYSVVSIKQAGLLNYFESPPSPDCIFLCNKQYENPPSPLVLLFHVVKSEMIILASVLTFTKGECHSYLKEIGQTMPERIYNPIMAMGFSTMFTFQQDNTKR